jgi:predicted ATPase
MFALFWDLLSADALLLLEEPEISLHEEIVRQLPALIHTVRTRQKRRRQVLLTTHSQRMLDDKGVAPEEVLILKPASEGTEVMLAASEESARELVAAGVPVGEAIGPLTGPNIDQLAPLS